MKTALIITLLLSSTMTWANPLLLSCIKNRQTTTLNIEDLVGTGCKSKTIPVVNGQIRSRYNVTLCDGQNAEGTIEVFNSQGAWIEIDSFSTNYECTLFRQIETHYPCQVNRWGHNGGCDA